MLECTNIHYHSVTDPTVLLGTRREYEARSLFRTRERVNLRPTIWTRRRGEMRTQVVQFSLNKRAAHNWFIQQFRLRLTSFTLDSRTHVARLRNANNPPLMPSVEDFDDDES